MKIDFSTFLSVNIYTKNFISTVLAVCLLLVFIEGIKFWEFDGQPKIYSIIILLIFILSIRIENKFTTIVLIIFNILFWYYNITERKDLSWYDNPINHYDSYLYLIKLHSLNLSFFNNILIWVIILPFRIHKIFFHKNATI